MALMILIAFCVFIVYSKPNNMTLSAFSEKNLWNWKIIFKIFFRLPTQGLNQLINLVQNRYLGSLANISNLLFLVFTLTLKLRVVHIRKKFKKLIFPKMAPTILIKFCGLIVHLKPNNVILVNFPRKIPETGKIF